MPTKNIKKVAKVVKVCAIPDHTRMWVEVDGKVVLHIHMLYKLELPPPMLNSFAEYLK